MTETSISPVSTVRPRPAEPGLLIGHLVFSVTAGAWSVGPDWDGTLDAKAVVAGILDFEEGVSQIAEGAEEQEAAGRPIAFHIYLKAKAGGLDSIVVADCACVVIDGVIHTGPQRGQA